MKKIGALFAQLLVSTSSTLVSRGVVKFGPGNCVSAWVGEASHCVVRTACGAQPAFAAYAIRVVCVDEDGGRVLHTFQQGGFDTEETFDTNIKCHRVETGDSVQVPQLSVAATSKGTAGSASEATQHSAAAAGVAANEAASQQLSKLESQVQLLTSNEMEMKREIEELQARLNGSESRALRGRTEEGSRSTQALDTVAAALAAVSAPKTQSQQSPAGHTHPAKPAPSAMQAPPASPAKLASRVHITAASPSTAKPVAAPATVAAFSVQDPTIAASAENAAQEAEKAAAEAELEAQGAQALAPPVKLTGSGTKKDLEDEKLVSLMDDGDTGDDA